jgi:hypothetical protein
MSRWLDRVLVLLGLRRHPPGDGADPHAWRPVPRQPLPKNRSGAIAVLEPDEERRSDAAAIGGATADFRMRRPGPGRGRLWQKPIEPGRFVAVLVHPDRQADGTPPTGEVSQSAVAAASRRGAIERVGFGQNR